MASSREKIARRLFAQYRQARPFQPLADSERQGPLIIAYDIQDRLQELFIADGKGHVAGYKVALTSAAMQAFVGVTQPLAGAIFSNSIHESPASLDLRLFQHIGVECEIAVRLATDIPSCSEGHTAESIAPAIGSVMAAFELIEDRNADYDAIDAFSLVADNAWNAGIVCGSPIEDWETLDLLSTKGTLCVNGDIVGEGKGADALGNPLAAVAWLADLLAARGRCLKRDMVVMTGSIVPTYFPAPDDEMVFSLDQIGDVRLSLVKE